MFNPKSLIQRTPFFYGWVIVACAMCANFARQGSAVATLSIFAVPMSLEFDWSRTAFSGAVSLGGILGAIISPKIGAIVDRRGAGMVLAMGTLLIGVSMLALSQTSSLIWFYFAYCLGRMAFAGPFEIAVTSAVANWFVRLRGRAMSLAALSHSIGLTVLPIVAYAAIEHWDWRTSWLVIVALVVAIGVVPNAFLMIQRPEDVGLHPYTGTDRDAERSNGKGDGNPTDEVSFTRKEASRTRTFWLLVVFSAFIYPVQAGVSLHQAPHLIERGVSLAVAATAVSSFSLMAAIGGLVFGQLENRIGARRGLAAAAALMAVGTIAMLMVSNAWTAYLSAVTFGAGIGGLMTLLPVAWANSFGRQNLGAIRGVTMPVQTLAQASGPLLSGVLYDATGGYETSLIVFCLSSLLAAGLALFAAHPGRPKHP
ncbi:MAG: MFS transporter [Pseudomonadota bacterium]